MFLLLPLLHKSVELLLVSWHISFKQTFLSALEAVLISCFFLSLSECPSKISSGFWNFKSDLLIIQA